VTRLLLPSLREALTRACDALPASPPPEARNLAVRLSDRLTRDLLPRTAGEEAILVAAIAGPNNVGKSSLFNALVGRSLSPARAEGGLTKQCLAAAHPSAWTGELRAFVERRYQVIEVAPGEVPPVDQAGPPGRLYLVLEPGVPRQLLLLDTPDFDSIYPGNRASAEALLVTADLVLFVTSRQTYQNAALVDFLRAAVGEGRPFAFVYNEAARVETARAHLDKLESDVGQAPVGRFLAPHQPEVEAGLSLLKTEPLDGGLGLQGLLADAGQAERLKARALEASLSAASLELGELAGLVRAAAQEPERLRARLRHELLSVGVRAALKGVPADVLIEAFRDELDARSAFHALVRMPFRGLATALTFVGRKVREAFTGPAVREPPAAALGEEALRDGVRQAVEALAPEVAAWRGDATTRALLEESFGPVTLAKVKGLVLPEVRDTHRDREALYAFSRQLISRELPGGAKEELFQTFTTLVYSVPTGAAALVTAGAGPMGHDAVIWAGTLLSTPLLERFVDALGSQLRGNVTQRWSQEHGGTLARGLERELFAPVLARLDALAEEAQATGRKLEAAREGLPGATA
jgi:hypothetical protein